MKYVRIFFALLLAVLLGACSHSSETTLNTVSWVAPDTGTTYMYESTPNPVFDTVVILKTMQHLGGKTNVIAYADHLDDGMIDTGFYNLETNGDFSFGNGTALDSLGNPLFTWKTYPTGSRQAINLTPPVDSIATNGSHIIYSDVTTFVGVENLTLLSETLTTLHARETLTDIDSIPNDSLRTSYNKIEIIDLWFAPSLGNYVKQSAGQGANTLIKYIPQ